MGHTNKQMIEARVEELIFAVDMIENHKEQAKHLILNKIDDLLELIREKANE